MAGIEEGVLRRIYLRITSICGCLSVTLFLCAGARTMGPMKDQRQDRRRGREETESLSSFLPPLAMSATLQRKNAVFARETRRFEAWKPHRSFIPPHSPSFPFIMAFAPGAIILSGADMTAPPQTNHRRKEGKSEGAKTKRLVLSFFPSFHSAHTRCFLFEIPRHIESRLIFVAVRRGPTLK